MIDLRGMHGSIVRIYDSNVAIFALEGPPTIVVGTETCTLGLHMGASVRLGCSAGAALDALRIDPDRCLRLTEPESGLIFHIIHPERIQIVSGDKATTLILRDFGVLVVREKPLEVREAIETLAPHYLRTDAFPGIVPSIPSPIDDRS